MKKFIAMIALLLSCACLFSCASVNALSDADAADTKANEKTDKNEASTALWEMNLESYMHSFVRYFHEPYQRGEDLPDADLLHMCFLFALYNADAGEGIEIDEEQFVMTLPGTAARMIATALLGDDFDLTLYHSYLENAADTYDAETDTYTVPYARDFWGEDKYCLDIDTPLMITENGDTVTVTAVVQYWPDLGIVESARKMQYTFDKINKDGYVFYRIREIVAGETVDVSNVRGTAPKLPGYTIPYESPLEAFLDAEQIAQYYNAVNIYKHLFGLNSDDVNDWEDWETVPGSHEIGTVALSGEHYTESWGPFANYDDFDTLIHSVFTDAFWAERNKIESGSPKYVNVDGKLCYISGAAGSGEYNPLYGDEYTLVEQTDDLVVFTITAHYLENNRLLNGESYEEWEQRLRTNYDYTREFTIRMVRTEDGWRFDQFRLPAVEMVAS